MKEKYITPETKIILFKTVDVIATSGENVGDGSDLWDN